jgi:hypothetical protein
MADTFPTGAAFVESLGWEEDEEHGRRLIARLIFPSEAPDISAAVVWKKRPVKIAVLEELPDG